MIGELISDIELYTDLELTSNFIPVNPYDLVDFADRCRRACWYETKNPNDIEFYGVDASGWSKGQSITNATFIATEDSELVIDTVDILGSQVLAKISGGIEGVHLVSVTITTNRSRVSRRNVKIKVKNI